MGPLPLFSIQWNVAESVETGAEGKDLRRELKHSEGSQWEGLCVPLSKLLVNRLANIANSAALSQTT